MNRSKKLVYNTAFGIINQLIGIICGFILPRAILGAYGSEINGLVSSVTQFISFISFADMGIISVVQASLYEPLYKNNYGDVSRIIISANKFFHKVAAVLILYVLVLTAVYPFAIDQKFDRKFTAALIVIISITSFLQYYFCLSYRILLSADQKDFIYLFLMSLTTLSNTVFSVVLIKFGSGIISVKLISALVFLIVPITLNLYVKKNYRLDLKLKLTEEPIKQKWNGLAQHIAFIVLQNTDVAVLTLFASLTDVSIYQVYHLVVSGIRSLISSVTTGISPLMGNLIAAEEKNKLNNFFDLYEWGFHSFATLIYMCTAVLIVPFVRVYTSKINDADYIVPIFGVILTAAYYVCSLRTPYQSLIQSAGHFKQTQTSSLIEAGINIILSLLSVIKFGLVGVAVGTLAAMLYRTIYLVFYLRKNILNRPTSAFLKNILTDLLIVLISSSITRCFNFIEISWISWLVMSIKVFLTVFLVTAIVNLIINRKMIKYLFVLLRRKLN